LFNFFVIHSKIKGHTYFSTDRASGPFRAAIKYSDIWTISHLTEIANSITNFNSRECDISFFKNWQKFLEEYFIHIPLSGIHLIMGTIQSISKGVIYIKKSSNVNEEWIPIETCRKNIDFEKLKNSSPEQLYFVPLLVKPAVQWEVYQQRRFVPVEYHQFYPEVPKVDKNETIDQDQEIEEMANEIQEDFEEMQQAYLLKQKREQSANVFQQMLNQIESTATQSREDIQKIIQERTQKQKEKQKEKEKERDQKRTFNTVDLLKNTILQLKARLKERGEPINGNKSDLVLRLEKSLLTKPVLDSLKSSNTLLPSK